MIFDFCQCHVGCRRSNKQFVSKSGWVRTQKNTQDLRPCMQLVSLVRQLARHIISRSVCACAAFCDFEMTLSVQLGHLVAIKLIGWILAGPSAVKFCVRLCNVQSMFHRLRSHRGIILGRLSPCVLVIMVLVSLLASLQTIYILEKQLVILSATV